MFPKIDCEKSAHDSFVMAFLYTNKGTVVYTGSLDRIEEQTKHLDTCHGFVLYFPRKKKKAQEFLGNRTKTIGIQRILNSMRDHDYRLFGKNTDACYKDTGVYLSLECYSERDFNSLNESLRSYMDRNYSHIKTHTDERKRWFLSIHSKSVMGKTSIVLRSWRKLPQQYLNELAEVKEKFLIPTR
jgi:hypothetical protein